MSGAELVTPEVAETVRRLADQAEAERRLPLETMTALDKAGLLDIYTPAQFGGAGLPLPEALRAVEAVSRLDGSAGWIVALGFSNDLFTSVLEEAPATRVLSKKPTVIAGSPGFNTRAVKVERGYRLTGRWLFASGCRNASWMGTIAPVFEGENPKMGAEGLPESLFMFLPPSDVQIMDVWHVTGLRATGSNDLEADNAFVPAEMTGPFSMQGAVPVRGSALARVPFMTLLAIVQSPPVCLGIASHAVEAFATLAAQKQRANGPKLVEQVQTQVGVARGEALIRSASAYYYQAVERVWTKAIANDALTLAERADARMACLVAVENSLAAVDSIYRLAGSSSIFQSSEIERCWRDVHTAAQHGQVQDVRWETAGRILLGLEPASSVI
jgi:alkylation response protein AidB-like acyl-CoA dehydrogenase